MSQTQFDVIVLGAGPGGYVAAIRAAQLGMQVAIVEKSNLGGTCLNVGCIPSKALLHSTEIFSFIKTHGAEHGITAKGLAMDVSALMEKKQSVVSKLRGGIDQLLKARKITHFKGTGKLLGNSKVGVTALEGATQEISAKNIIIATGSAPIELPFMRFDGELVISSDHAIALPQVPKKLVVVGAGAIGLELGCVWNRLGSDVTIVELLPNVAPTFDMDICKAAQRVFTKQGLKFELGAKVTGIKKVKGKAFLTAERDGQVLEFEADKILVAVGRKPYTDGLGADTAGVALDDRKRVAIDKHYATNVPGIYAIGDVTTGPMLAHKAEDEGIALAEMLAGKAGHVNYDTIPNVVYTDPEIASVGLSEQEARNQGYEVTVGKMPFASNGRALACDATDGLAKVIACAKTDRLLGVQMMGRNVSEIIAEAVAHMEYGGSAEDLARTVHAHPTLSETLKEAAMAVEKRAIHGI